MNNTKFDLSGKVAIITGGNGGLGLGIAKGLAIAGRVISNSAAISAIGRSPSASIERMARRVGSAKARKTGWYGSCFI